MDSARRVLEQFDEQNLPDLDTVVLDALELFDGASLPQVTQQFREPLVVGSVGAYTTGKIIFNDTNAVFADESTFEHVLDHAPDVDGAYIVSASGGKHAPHIAKTLSERNIARVLLTTNPDAPAKEFIESDSVLVFPKNREPYTYNTSTYLGMIFARTGENPAAVAAHVTDVVTPQLRTDLSQYQAFTFILPKRYGVIAELIRTKFDEMFAPIVTGRAFTEEEIKHAKTVIPSKKECFISIGVTGGQYGDIENRMHVPLPENADYAAVMATSYYIVGTIQKQHPPYFKENIAAYCKRASQIFGEKLSVIVT